MSVRHVSLQDWRRRAFASLLMCLLARAGQILRYREQDGMLVCRCTRLRYCTVYAPLEQCLQIQRANQGAERVAMGREDDESR